MTDSQSSGLVRVIARTLAAAPRRMRQSASAMLACWLVLVALQIADVAGRSGPGVFAELVSVLVGSMGTLVFGLAWVLHVAAAQETAPTPGEPAIHQMRVALPVLGFVAGALFAFAVGVAVVRVALGSPAGVLGIAFWAFLLVLCGRSVADATRWLYARARDEGEAAVRARAEAADARLAALQSEMKPHFLFNALNTVAALVRADPRAAERTIEDLGDVLRRTLDHSRAIEVPLEDELEYVRAYLGVEKSRWGDRLAVTFEVAPEARSARVPPLTLQPLVENAIAHGIGPRIGPGRVIVRAALDGGGLRLEVEDDGVGFAPRAREGTGLGNLRGRLATLYGDAAGLEVADARPGTRVIVRLPAPTEA